MDAADPVVAGLAERVRQASAQRSALQIRGGGTKAFYGEPARGSLLDVGACRGISAYEPTELYITARCGTPLAEVEAALAGSGQMLPFEPPHFGAGATIGGCVAAGLAGPRRIAPAGGAVRDFVLGATLLDGRGQLLRFGGSVMKNVAGYDVARVLAGSLGILGVLLEVTLKVAPRPRAEATVRLALDEADMLRRVNALAGRPLPISATAWRAGMLMLRLSGARAAIDEASRELGGAIVDPDEAQSYWRGLREQTDPFFAPGAPGPALWRIALPSATGALAAGQPTLAGHPYDQLIEWGGAQRWLRTDAPAGALRAAAAAHGGHATRFRAGARDATAPQATAAAADDRVFTPLAAPLMAIHRRLKDAFDPAAIFNPGRLYPDL